MTEMDQVLNEAFRAVLPRKKSKWAPLAHEGRFPIGGRSWRDQVKGKLIDGFGVEDIAIHLGCHLSHVKAEVDRLRADGEFAKWWGRE